MLKTIDGYGIAEVLTPFGDATCLWKSRFTPIPNRSYEVEIEIKNQLVWGVNLKHCEAPSEVRFESTTGSTLFAGKLEAVFEDGFCAIRIGDNLITVQTQGLAVEIGTFVIGYAGHAAILFDSET